MKSKEIQTQARGVFQNILKFQIEKRKFLAASFSLFGALPAFQFLKIGNHNTPYFFLASIIGKYSPEEDRSNFRNKQIFKGYNDRMLDQRKILNHQVIQLKNNISYLYIFDSKESFLSWKKKINDSNKVFPEKLPSNVRYFQTEGFLV